MALFKEMLKYLRNREHLSQAELASKLGISKSTISMYEVGRREPDFETLEAIADFFNVDINFLLGRKDSENSYYTDPETAKLAQEMFEDPEMRSLYHMKRNMTPERFQRQMEQFKDMYRLEHPEDSDFGC